MKKFLASVLAVSMVASMSAVSFAADADWVVGGQFDKVPPEEAFGKMIKEKNGKFYYNKEDGYPIYTDLIGPFGYDAEDKNLTTGHSIEFGKTAYYLLTNLSFINTSAEQKYTKETGSSIADADDFSDMIDTNMNNITVTDGEREHSDSDIVIVPSLVTNSDTTTNLKIKEDLEEGKDILKGLTVTKKKVSDIGTYKHDPGSDTDDEFIPAASDSEVRTTLQKYGFEQDKYYYMVAMSLEKSSSVSDADLIGNLTISKSKKPEADDIEFDIGVNVDWENSYRDPDQELEIDGDFPGPLLAEKYYAVKFNGDEESEIEFEDESTFTVDISGQGKLLMYYDTEFNSKVASRNPLAELNFWNGNGAKFNRTGEFFLRVGDDAEDYAQYLYQVNADGTLSEVPGAEYDDGDGGFYFKTRTLGTYVYSDMELETSNSNAGNASDKDDNVVAPPVTPVAPVAPVNPGTGARA